MSGLSAFADAADHLTQSPTLVMADERMSAGPQSAHLGVALFDMAGLVRIAILI